MISIKKINDKMYNLSKPKFIFTILILDFIVSVLLVPLKFFYEKHVGSIGGANIQNLIALFIIAIVVCPLYETLIYQFGVIRLLSLNKRLKNNKLVLIIVSSMIFGLVHSYSMLYIFLAFVHGLFLAYSFVVYEEKGQSGYWITAIIHSLMNLTTFILKIF